MKVRPPRFLSPRFCATGQRHRPCLVDPIKPDGSLRIVIQHDQPTAKVNWLPAPTGEFFLILRTYEPNESLLSGAYKVPPVQKVA